MSKQWQMEKDYSYQSDCLIYTIFSNHIISQYGTNHWIPFTEAEVEAKDNFESHFMSDFCTANASQAKQTPSKTFWNFRRKLLHALGTSQRSRPQRAGLRSCTLALLSQPAQCQSQRLTLRHPPAFPRHQDNRQRQDPNESRFDRRDIH